MADHPDIPALVARFTDYATQIRVGNAPLRVTVAEAEAVAAALSRLTRALAERDAEIAVLGGLTKRYQRAFYDAEVARLAAERERDEAREALAAELKRRASVDF